ncbi:MAG: threonylcarbamoyl-AMP synthase [Treponema sp.]|jgi:L-threonylcarbamoyladenylate synthase|nr:threonylcarbamoyl-AMP synthase [Treponema sp.]
MRLFTDSEEDIRRAAALLSGGGLVAFPTETVYGLGGDAFNPAALARIFEVKNRPRFDPLIIHIAGLDSLERVADLSLLDGRAREKLAALTARLWPGPLTLILPKRKEVPDLATSGLATAAVRLPDHPAARKLISLSTGAVAAPSANPFGYLSPTRAEHVRNQLGGRVDAIIDGGPSRVGLESTVLDICGAPRILRPGGAAREDIEALIGPVLTGQASAGPVSAAGPGKAAADLPPGADTDVAGGLRSPGQLKSHYAPHSPLLVHAREEMPALAGAEGEALLFFDGRTRDEWIARAGEGAVTRLSVFGGEPLVRVLSESGNLLEAAARLFEALHELDGLARIHAQLAPERGLGAAINDRLRRAAAKG